MAVLMMLELPGATPEQYDRANEILGIAGDEDAPDGLISHAAGLTDEGMVIVDVWDSPESRDKYRLSDVESQRRQAMAPFVVHESSGFYTGRELGIPKGGA